MAGKAREKPLSNIGARSLVDVSPKCLHEILRKQDKLRQLLHMRWSHKFVVLAHTCLYVFGNESSTRYEVAFSMADVKCVSEHTRGDQYFYLTFHDPDREHIVFSCDTNKSQKKWLKKLRKAMDEASDSGIGHDDMAEESDDEDICNADADNKEDNMSAMAAAKRPNTYMQINDNDALSTADDCSTSAGNHGEEPQYENTRHQGGKPNNKQPFGTSKEKDEESKHSFIPTDNRNSSSSSSSADSENAFIIVSGGEGPIVPKSKKVKADHGTSTFENSYKNVHHENDAHDISLENPENDDQRTHGQPNITGVYKDCRQKTYEKMENKNRYQMNSASETENAMNHVSGRADHSLIEVKKKEASEQPTHGQSRIQEVRKNSQKTDAGMDDNLGYPIDTNSFSASETNPENAMAHVFGREGHSLKASNNKGTSPWIKERINVLERTLKFPTTMWKGLPRSCSSSKLQGSAQTTVPVVPGAKAPLQDESLYENSQDLYENLERPCQEK